jgi:hypothetical protein
MDYRKIKLVKNEDELYERTGSMVAFIVFLLFALMMVAIKIVSLYFKG